MKKIIWICKLLILVLALVACRSEDASEEPTVEPAPVREQESDSFRLTCSHFGNGNLIENNGGFFQIINAGDTWCIENATKVQLGSVVQGEYPQANILIDGYETTVNDSSSWMVDIASKEYIVQILSEQSIVLSPVP